MERGKQTKQETVKGIGVGYINARGECEDEIGDCKKIGYGYIDYNRNA